MDNPFSTSTRDNELITLQLTRAQLKQVQESVALASRCFGKKFPCASCGNECCTTLNLIVYFRGLLNA